MKCTAVLNSEGVTSNLTKIVTEGDIIIVNCSLDFNGGWAPDLSCESDTFNATNVINITSLSKAAVSVTFYVGAGYDEGVIYCSAKFQDVDIHLPPDVVTDSGIRQCFRRLGPREILRLNVSKIHI